MNELIARCPFCGSSEVRMNAARYVECRNCMAYGPTEDTEAKSIYAWNTPTLTIERLTEDAERLRRELDDANGVIR